ncbi:MAG: hypothetical protein ACREU6_10985, partial [Steroidobacteraceae bacterium]
MTAVRFARLLVGFLVALAFGPAWPADLIITHARVFSGTGASEMPDASIAVTGGRIESISRGAMAT